MLWLPAKFNTPHKPGRRTNDTYCEFMVHGAIVNGVKVVELTVRVDASTNEDEQKYKQQDLILTEENARHLAAKLIAMADWKSERETGGASVTLSRHLKQD